MNSDLAIDVRGMNKTFGDKHVVRDLSLQVARGEIFGFLGPNGSGKTTSIRMMCGLLTPDSGEGTCLGYDIIKQSGQIKRRVGYMTQRFSMWEDMTIRENFDFVARMYELPDRRQRVDDTLRRLGLEPRASQRVSALSGGWKQRMALAACMLHEPELLLLDEPTAGVDPKARRDFWEELHQLAAKGTSILVSTHYMDEAERCHKLAYIFNGKLIAQGTAKEVVEKQHISTFAIHGGDLAALSRELKGKPGVDQTIAFGEALHVSGEDEETLKATLTGIQKDSSYEVEPINTGLEDVFIHLVNTRIVQGEKKNS
ncbi:MAG: ABC transporter ATP-binding protein [Nitrospiria bacterium]